eukprot:TRINITY_DN68_c0_g1_i2.p2 TRINITY_DN68_c0_g1~~TRINITY_DN68_c0_g1_i2.p2  ORF type:complete len:154 (-),score=18.93 TRINITY_DN68_c0_g1_i2:3449-3910(-)
MGLLDTIWDDTMGGPTPEKGMNRLSVAKMSPSGNSMDQDSPRSPASLVGSPQEDSLHRRMSSEMKRDDSGSSAVSQNISISTKPPSRTSSLPSAFSGSPGSVGMVSPGNRPRGENVWRSVFHPGSNKAMQQVHSGPSGKWDHAAPGSPSVSDW